MKKKWFYIFIAFVSTILNAQQSKIDSLTSLYNQTDIDTVKLEFLINIINEEFYHDVDKYIFLTDSLANYAKRIGDKLNVARTYNMKGRYYERNSMMDTARHLYKKAIPLYSDLNKELFVAEAYNNIALTFMDSSSEDSVFYYLDKSIAINERMGDAYNLFMNYYNYGVQLSKDDNEIEAIDYLIKALKQAEKLVNKYFIGMTHSMLGVIYKETETWDMAFKHQFMSLEIFHELNNLYGLATTFTNLGTLESGFNSNYNKAIAYYKKSFALYDSLGHIANKNIALGNIGRGYIHLKMLDSANYYLNKSKDLAETIEHTDELPRVYTNLGEVALLKNDLNRAKKYTFKAISLAEKYKSIENYADAKIILADIYKKEGDYKKAFENLNVGNKILDSLTSVERVSKIKTIETKYQTEKKEKENLKLKQEKAEQELALAKESRNKWIGFGSSITLSLLLVSGYLFVRSRKRKMEKDQLLKQIWVKNEERNRFSRVLHNEIANPLLGIYKKMEVKNMQEEADSIKEVEERMRELSHRYEVTPFKETDLIEQLENVVIDLSEQNIRVEMSGIDVLKSFALEQSTQRVIFNIIQESFINTMKYADASQINIKFSQEGKKLHIRITDNGNGFDSTQISKDREIFRNIKAEVNTLNGKFDFNTAPGKGTTIFTSFLLT